MIIIYFKINWIPREIVLFLNSISVAFSTFLIVFILALHISHSSEGIDGSGDVLVDTVWLGHVHHTLWDISLHVHSLEANHMNNIFSIFLSFFAPIEFVSVHSDNSFLFGESLIDNRSTGRKLLVAFSIFGEKHNACVTIGQHRHRHLSVSSLGIKNTFILFVYNLLISHHGNLFNRWIFEEIPKLLDRLSS